jgi:hypothetical protein
MWAGRAERTRFNLLRQIQVQSRWKGNTYVGLAWLALGIVLIVSGIAVHLSGS